MNKMSYMITTLMLAIGFVFTVSNAVGQITMRFPVTRDVGIWAEGGEQMTTSGFQAFLRPLKLLENAVVMDFDTDAMGAFLQANTGTATWTFNLFNSAQEGFNVFPTGGFDMGIVTVESTNDWVAGDGNGQAQFNWTEGTPSATYFYAQTVYETTTFPGFPIVDVNASLEWNDPDSGRYTFTGAFPDDPANYGIPGTRDDWNLQPTPEFTNSASFLNADIVAAGFAADASGGPFSVVIDDDIINALITDENNRGLRFGPLANSQFTNWKIWGGDVGTDPGGASPPSADLVPYLEVTIETPPAGPGDFDEDGDIDGNDFLVWQRGGSPNGATAGDLNEWETNYGPAAVAVSTSVPEPTTGLLFSIGLGGLWGRRRK